MTPEELAYPPVVLEAVGLVGVVLLVVRPRWLVVLTWAAVLTVDNAAYTYTRVGSGLFLFNLYDLLLVLGLGAALRVSEPGARRRLLAIPAALVAILLVGLSLTWLERDLVYEDLRAFRFAVFFPAAWAIGALGARGSGYGRWFAWVLVGAVAFQSSRLCLYVAAFPDPGAGEASWRTLRFLNAGLAFVPTALLLAAEGLSLARRLVLVAVTAVAVVALVLTQTRSLWIPQAVVALALVAWRARSRGVFRSTLVGAFTIAAVMLGARVFFGATEGRVDLWTLFTEGHATDLSHGTGREESIAAETRAWLDGNWLLGRGLGFQNGPGFDDSVSWGHNGYTSYLANLGLLGFFAYGVAIPLAAVRWARDLRRGVDATERALGVLVLATSGFAIVATGLSSGLLAGPGWAMYALLTGVASAFARGPTPGGRARHPWSALVTPSIPRGESSRAVCGGPGRRPRS